MSDHLAYIINGYAIYAVIFLIGGYALVVDPIIHRHKRTFNPSYRVAWLLLLIGIIMLIIDMIRWILIGYHEEVTIFDTMGPRLFIIGIIGLILSNITLKIELKR